MAMRYTIEEGRRLFAEYRRQDIRIAKDMLSMFQRHNDSGIRIVVIPATGGDIFVLNCASTSSPTLATDAYYVNNEKDSVWFKRPVTPDDASRCVSLVRDFVEAVIATSDDNLDVIHALSSYVIHIAYEKEDLFTYKFSAHYAEICALKRGVEEIFLSVSPPSDFEGEVMSHMSCFEYRASGLLGTCYTNVRATRSDDGVGHCLSYEVQVDEGIASDRSTVERSMPLTNSEWDSIAQALVQADLTDWQAGNVRPYVCNGIEQYVDIEFDDGWGIRIRERNLWDSRFLSVAKELMRYGLEEADLFVSFSELSAKDHEASYDEGLACSEPTETETNSDVDEMIAELRRILEENAVVMNLDDTISEVNDASDGYVPS